MPKSSGRWASNSSKLRDILRHRLALVAPDLSGPRVGTLHHALETDECDCRAGNESLHCRAGSPCDDTACWAVEAVDQLDQSFAAAQADALDEVTEAERLLRFALQSSVDVVRRVNAERHGRG